MRHKWKFCDQTDLTLEYHGHNAAALVQLALDMREAVASRTFGDQKLAFRIGINSGPVVAGVIGRKKFIYDLWGAAVNLASRMESHGESGTIQITRSSYDLIKDQFDCESRGTIKVKGADDMEVWHVLGRKPTRGPPSHLSLRVDPQRSIARDNVRLTCAP